MQRKLRLPRRGHRIGEAHGKSYREQAAHAVGLGGRSVFGTLLAASGDLDAEVLKRGRGVEPLALTLLPGLLVARYLGDSSQEAMTAFTALWKILRPALLGREAIEPRIWST